LDAAGLVDGVYMIQVSFESNSGIMSRQNLKLILQR